MRWFGTEVTDAGWSVVEFEGREPVALIAEGLSADDANERLEFANAVTRLATCECGHAFHAGNCTGHECPCQVYRERAWS